MVSLWGQDEICPPHTSLNGHATNKRDNGIQYETDKLSRIYDPHPSDSTNNSWFYRENHSGPDERIVFDLPGDFPSLSRGFRQLLFIFFPLSLLILLDIWNHSVAQPPETRWLVMPAPNPDMTYMLQPNSDFVTFGVPFRTNELGFRDGPIVPKSPNMFRILCVGDSVTFGTGVTNEETFPNVLERQLQQYTLPGIVVDVINAGVSAYNARNIRGLLEYYLSQLKPDVVVYIFVENDLDDSVSAGFYGEDRGGRADHPGTTLVADS